MGVKELEKTKWVFALFAEIKQGYNTGGYRNLKNFPLYCPKCKQENLIDAKELHITIIKR